MKRLVFASGILLAATPLLGPLGCKSKPAPNPVLARKAAVPVAQKDGAGAWKIAAQGSRFDPPVEIAAIPDKTWFCDMGTVHYAQAEAGDKTCKLCKMKLKQKGQAPAADAKPDGHGHPHKDHAGHGDEHPHPHKDHGGHGDGHPHKDHGAHGDEHAHPHADDHGH